MEKFDFNELKTEEKIWFAHAIAGMVVADGRVDKTEKGYLKDSIEILNNREEISLVMSIARKEAKPILNKINIESRTAFNILKYLMELMITDSRVTIKEVNYFIYVGQQIGFSKKIMTKLWKSGRNQLLSLIHI